jgi:superfamily I DNA/RNA helicase
MRLSEIIRINYPKKLWTDKGEGDKIKLVRTATDNEEGKFVADTIQERKATQSFFLITNSPFYIVPMPKAAATKKVCAG